MKPSETIDKLYDALRDGHIDVNTQMLHVRIPLEHLADYRTVLSYCSLQLALAELAEAITKANHARP